MKLTRIFSVISTALIFAVIGYAISSFTAWSIDLREWSPIIRFIWLCTILLPFNNYTKKYVQV